MEAHRFGQYLVNCQVVTQEDVLGALRIQDSRIIRIGELAINNHYITRSQLQNILHQQHGTNEYFCEVAVRLGYITSQQASNLIELQLRSRPKLGQILVEQHLIDQHSLTRHLNDYHRKYSGSLPSDDTSLVSATG